MGVFQHFQIGNRFCHIKIDFDRVPLDHFGYFKGEPFTNDFKPFGGAMNKIKHRQADKS